ncbi:MAG: TetR/AcrR family transcriptional regulator [Oleiphilus sp.]
MASERGRPRGFDIDIALESALHIFWKNGYQSASMQELTAAMCLSKPSLYAAFGSKKTLYLKSLARYLNLLVEDCGVALTSEPDAYKAVQNFLLAISKLLTNPNFPGGCFIINGIADLGGSATPEDVNIQLRAALKGSETMLQERLLRAKNEGQLSTLNAHTDLAMLYSALISGLAVQAKSGASEERLNDIIRMAMAAWPKT